VPRGLKLDNSRALFRRSAVASILLHLALVAVALAIQYWPSSTIVGTPQDQILNVSIIPLSALDTILPKGSTVDHEIPKELTKEEKAVEPVTPKVEKASQPKKIVAAKSIASVRQESRKQEAQDSKQSDQQNNTLAGAQQIGVANGEATSLEQARISYQDMVATRLARAKRYPERALKRRMTGEGTIRIEISANGSLSGFQIIQSTAAPILDEELRAMVERASPFPAFPADLQKGSLALVVPVAFRLEG
jgi:protein TonB